MHPYINGKAIHNKNFNPSVVGIFFLILVYIGRVQELLPVLKNIPVGKIAVGLSLLLFFITPDKTSMQTLKTIPQIKYILWILILSIVSLVFSVWPGGSYNFLTDVFLKTLLFLFILITVINRREDIRAIVWGVVAAVFLLSSKIMMMDKIGRMSTSSSYDPNDLAFVMVSLMPLIYYFMKSENGIRKYFLLTTIIIMMMTVMYTVSRGGFLGFAAIVLIIIYREKRSLSKVLFYSGIIGCFLLLVAPDSFWNRMSTTFDEGTEYNYQAGGSGRIAVWKRGAALMLENPVFGVGIGGFPYAEGLTHGGLGKWSTAHNSFIEIGAELGIFGLIFFIKLLTSSVRSMQECRKLNEPEVLPNWLLEGVEVALYGYIATGFFLSQAYSPVLYLLVGLGIISGNILSTSRRETAKL
jgi:O-antigen ligase